MPRLSACLLACLAAAAVCASPAAAIMGGRPVPAGQLPWAAALSSRPGGDPDCSASLVAARWALTAAHCVAEQRVRFDEPLWLTVPGRMPVQADRWIAPISHVPGRFAGDVELVHLAGDAGPARAALARPGQRLDGPALSAGFGDLGREAGHGLAAAPSRQARCPAPEPGDSPQAWLCARPGTDGSGAACDGDAGGPVVIAGRLAGVHSYGLGECWKPRALSASSSVAFYASWISQVIRTGSDPDVRRIARGDHEPPEVREPRIVRESGYGLLDVSYLAGDNRGFTSERIVVSGPGRRSTAWAQPGPTGMGVPEEALISWPGRLPARLCVQAHDFAGNASPWACTS